MGKPKYFSRVGVDLNSRISHKFALVSGLTLGEKNTLDFALLTFCLDNEQNESRTSLTAKQFFLSAFAKRTRSLAKNRWEKASPHHEALIES